MKNPAPRGMTFRERPRAGDTRAGFFQEREPMCQNALAELESQGLDLGGVILKRARWEALEVVVVDADAGRVNVRNASKAEPSVYTVDVDDGVPESCTCPYDENRPDPCKHRAYVALNDVLLGALDAAADPEIVTDGGRDVTNADPDDEPACIADDPDPRCPDAGPDELPCFACWRAQRQAESGTD